MLKVNVRSDMGLYGVSLAVALTFLFFIGSASAQTSASTRIAILITVARIFECKKE